VPACSFPPPPPPVDAANPPAAASAERKPSDDLPPQRWTPRGQTMADMPPGAELTYDDQGRVSGWQAPQAERAESSEAMPTQRRVWQPEDIARSKQAFSEFIQDRESADALYDALPETQGGRVINTDSARHLNPDYAEPVKSGELRPLAVTEGPATDYMIDRLQRELSNRGARQRLHLVTGGWGAGKSSAITADGADLTFDGTGVSPVFMRRVLDLALQNGWEVGYTHVTRPLELVGAGMMQRAMEEGRTGPVTTAAANHRVSQGTAVQMARDYAGRAKFRFVYNAGTRASPAPLRELRLDEVSPGGEYYLDQQDDAANSQRVLKSARDYADQHQLPADIRQASRLDGRDDGVHVQQTVRASSVSGGNPAGASSEGNGGPGVSSQSGAEGAVSGRSPASLPVLADAASAQKIQEDLTARQRARELLAQPAFEASTALAADRGSALREKAKAIFANILTRLKGVELPVTRDGRQVRFTMSGFRESAQHSADPRVLQLVPDLPALIRRAVPLWSEPSTKADKPNILAFHHYGTRVRQNGAEFLIRITLRQDTDGHIYYDNHPTDFALVNEVGGTTPSQPGRKANAREGTADAAKDRLLQWLAKVNAAQGQSGNGGPGASSVKEWNKTTFGQRLKGDERLRASWRETIGGQYRVESEAEWQQRANDFIEQNGLEGAFTLLMDPEAGLSDTDEVALAGQLVLSLDAAIRLAEQSGDSARAEMLDDLMHETGEFIEKRLTQHGQAVRWAGMWTRMSAEGVLRAFERKVHAAREEQMSLQLGKDPAKIADEVSATAAEERADVAAEALGETTTDQLAELRRQVAELRQQLAQATQEASAAQQEMTYGVNWWNGSARHERCASASAN